MTRHSPIRPGPRQVRRPTPAALTLGGLAVGGLLLTALFAIGGDAPAKRPAGPDLGGAERYLTHVGTDKPVYRVGERVYVPAPVLRADTRAPLPANQQMQALVEIRGPKGDVVASGYAPPQDGVVGFAWDVPDGTAGGEYTVKVSHPFAGHVPGERKFDVRAYRAPRVKSQIVFLRDGYGPGDTAAATLHAERVEGGIPAGAKVTAIARVDGVEVGRSETAIDARGNCSAKFELPKAISRGEGTLAWVIDDGGVVETATKTIPILLQTVDLTMYPEGGDLVAGLPGRVYLEAFTPAHKPADLAGAVVDADGREVAAFKTEHEGRGRFDFTPAKGGRYTLKIGQPSGIKTTYPLPKVLDEGAVLSAAADVTAADAPVRLRVARSGAGKVKVTLAKRDVELAAKTVDVPAGGQWADVELAPDAKAAGADGVLVATAWDEAGKPLAERLVFRQPKEQVTVKVTPDKSSYVPGEPVKLDVTTTDAGGKPVGAVVGVTVTDDSVLEMIEKREQAPRLPVMVLLEPEVRELADAHVYLDPANPKAPAAVDLLLGTQGWRRFALVEREKFVAANGDAARRVLALRVVTVVEEREAAATGPVFFDGAVPAPGPAGPAAVGGAALQGAVRANVRADPAAPAAAPDNAKEPPAEAPPPPALPAVPAVPPVPAGQPAAGLQMPAASTPAVRPPAGPAADQQLATALAKKQAADREAGQIAAGARPAGDLDARSERAVRNDFVVVREYAHAVRPDRRPGDRVDFAETLYWNAGVKTDDKTGRATVAFATSDAVTSFRVFTDAFTAAGGLGSSATAVESVQPFYAEPKLPLQVTSGDVIRLPVGLVNGTPTDLAAATVKATAAKGISVSAVDPFTLKAHARDRRLLNVSVGDYAGTSDFVLEARGGDFADRVTRKLDVQPAGFPVEWARGGLLGPDGAVSYTVEIPAGVVPNSVSSDLAVYPTPLANLTQAMEALIQSPSGCFEQTSSTTYPLVMAQQYFLSHTGVDPTLIDRSRTLLTDGYNRLTGFECKQSKGFEWFGADPGHEALSAYGLLEFTDMAAVREVDKRMLADTRAYVMKCRDGKGGFKRERATLHTWINDPDCSNGYITWALLECGQTGLEQEIAAAKEASAKSTNSYVIALGANTLFLAGDKEGAKKLMDKLAAKQTKDGMVDGGTTTIVGSGGDALQIETTSLATLAWLRDPSYAGNVEGAVRWLAEACKAGRYGSTQSTVLALRAIVGYDKARAHPKAPGTVQVIVDGKPMGGPQAFGPDTQGAIKLQDVREMMSPGKHTLELKMDKGSAMPFAVAVRYHTMQPPSSDECKVTIGVSLRDKALAEGGVTEADVTVTNRDKAAVPTPVAIVGIPGGLEVRHDRLKELVKQKKIDAYEVIGREVVLYWRTLDAGQTADVSLSLVAAVPGTYTAPASRAYLYYTDEFKQWVPGIGVTIAPKAGE